ncbi:MAG: hypothetical protein JRD89_19650 [Deltaproteobacteria bacterium]|nr:hypothetical protein [Deltaproteobacteria bacterium]
MSFDRIINDGKLDLVAQLVGGPGDGMRINANICGIGGEFRLARKAKEVQRDVWNPTMHIPQPDFSCHVYIRTSTQVFKYVGVT